MPGQKDADLAKGTYIVTLNEKEDDKVFVGNGVYLIEGDSEGKWQDIETRCAVGDIKMRGVTAPKKESRLKEKLMWKVAEIQKAGHPAVLPSCLTFSQFSDVLVKLGRIPKLPEEIGESSQGGSMAPDASQEVEVHSSPALLAHDDFQNRIDDVLDAIHTVDGQEGLDSETVQQDELPTLSNEQIMALKQHNALLQERILVLENQIAVGQTDQASGIARSVKGYIESNMKTMSTSIENTIKREIRSVHSEAISDHWVPMGDKFESLDSRIDELDNGMRSIRSAQETQDVALELLTQNSKFVKNKAALMFSRPPPASPSSSFGTPRTPQTTGATFNDSGVESPSTPAQPPKRCNFCNLLGHVWRQCKFRPNSFTCFRCKSADHKPEFCRTLKTPCSECNTVGHGPALHNVTDAKERLEIVMRIGPDPFKNWASATVPATTEREAWSATSKRSKS